MKIELSRIYNNQPYYSITNSKKVTYSAIGAEQTIKVIKDIRKNREKVDVESTDLILKEHSKLIKLIKELNQNEKSKTKNKK